MNSIGTIRRFDTKHFAIIVDAVEDDSSIDDLHSEKDAQDEILENLNSGKWTLFCARVRVLLDGSEIACAYLGGCIYADISEFEDHRECGKQNRERAAKGKTGRCGSYFADMIHETCKQARNHIKDVQLVRVRA